MGAVNVTSADEMLVGACANGRKTCALFDSGKVRCWGDGRYGATGLATNASTGVDEQPAALPYVNISAAGVRVRQIGCGNAFTCALLDDNSVRCFGAGNVGRLGGAALVNIGDDEHPVTLAVLNITDAPIRRLSVGHESACALLQTNGMARCKKKYSKKKNK